MILGIDEVGRGPWAGPMVVGAVVLGGAAIDGLTDSKKLTKKRREALDVEIREQAAGYGLGWVSAAEIDQIGLGPSLRLATKRAVQAVNVPFHEIIIDGTINLLADTPLEYHVTTMPKADLLVPSVSAASIIAKVARDNYMTDQDTLYPGYKFGSHAGYGTAAHRLAIERLGVTPLHRLSFAPLQKYAGVSFSGLSRESSHNNSSQPDPRVGSEDDTTRHMETTKKIGDRAEDEAANHLIRLGHEIIARNWKTKYCEIDIVSQKGGRLHFTEVKFRKNANQGGGLAAITPKKLNQMRYAAQFYAHSNKLRDVDLVTSAMSLTGDPPAVETYLERV